LFLAFDDIGSAMLAASARLGLPENRIVAMGISLVALSST
jgi:hypothetical protein